MAGDVVKIDANAMEWTERPNEAAGRSLYSKRLFEDPETGVKVNITKYPAGFINPNHFHHCAHGMFVLSGILHTSEGDFGPGEFVWFPEGKAMWHGATPDQDVQVIFVTNKKFDINYIASS